MDDRIAQREEAISGARAAQHRLIDDLSGLTDDQARSASLLPGWSVGHVLTHIARNADAFVRMLSAAIEGRSVTQYEGGTEGRAAGIEAGAARPAAELVADVRDSAARLEGVWAGMTPQAWDGHGYNSSGDEWPCDAMPFHRWREVAIHHVDLGLGYTAADWPDAYVARELAVGLRLLPERLDDADRRRLLTWLIGRSDQPTDLSLAAWQARPDRYLR
ncbi:MAG TPA: maleylpyruvate isomerase family mycothiol-dependent enzyme [Mycobacteriales bacterium]|nr:maleylpyruvate isomerase family mycothiol-dependent enzyme [Mycobacteriales bacterium]